MSTQYGDKLHMAEAMIDAKDYDNAIKYLVPIVQSGRRYENAPRALYDLTRAYEVVSPTSVVGLWERMVKEYPNSEYSDNARLYLIDELLKKNPQQARTAFQELQKNPKPVIAGKALLGVAKTYEAENNIPEARKLCKQIMDTTDYAEVQAPAKDFLSKIHTQMLWSPVLDDFCQLYEVERGDSPAKIGQKFKTTAWFISEANNIQGALRPGRKIKVPKEPFWIVVDKDKCRLNLLTENGLFIKWYPVGIGEQSYKTPAGDYSIINKEVDPVWFRTSGGIFRPGTPDNALGSRWMGIGKSLGIHGTNAPETIGFRKSAGCIRMYNQDVEELYKLVTYGTRVTIQETPGAGQTPS